MKIKKSALLIFLSALLLYFNGPQAYAQKSGSLNNDTVKAARRVGFVEKMQLFAKKSALESANKEFSRSTLSQSKAKNKLFSGRIGLLL